MKNWQITGFLVVLILGFLLISGCTSPTSQASAPTVTPLVTSTPIQTTSAASLTTTAQPSATSPQTTQKAEAGATLQISLGGYDKDASIYADNMMVGNATPGTPFTVKLTDGNHEIKVCKGTVCVTRNVLTSFGKVTPLEIGEEFKNALKESEPSAKIINSVSSADAIIVNVEFSNPTQDDLFMTATVLCTYTYTATADEPGQGGRNPTMGTATAKVPAGGRVISNAELPMKSKSNSLAAAAPTITDFKFSKVVKNNA
jgi:hypothetical protein